MTFDRPTKRRKVSPPVSSLPGFTRWNLEEDYEKRKGKARKQDAHQRLPFKTSEGRIVEQEQSQKDVDEDSGDSAADSGIADVETPELKADLPKLSHKEEVIRAKEDLARAAELLSENPEEHIALLQTLRDHANSSNAVVQKLALGTQLAVYKDIVPGYRIRPISKEDMNAKVSKEVKKLRAFEQSLLAGYSVYVKTLAHLARNRKEDSSLAALAVSCACELLRNLAHFNFRNDLIDIVVKQLSRPRPDAAGSFQRITSALEAIFEQDEDGHSSLEVVSRLTAMMKDKHFHIHESVLNTFLSLRLLNEFRGKASTQRVQAATDDADESAPSKLSKKKREFRTKRERKHLREVKDVEKEMREADAAVSHEERDKNQGETLKLIFVTYFRILKARTPHLTGAVLEGLARYAHLINQDFFGDVLEVLRELIVEARLMGQAEDEQSEDEDEQDDVETPRNVTREGLLCTTTAFAMLQGQTDVVKSAGQLQLDLSFFTTHLFRSLPDLAIDADIELSEKNAHLQDPNGLATAAADTKVNVATTIVLLMRSLLATLLPAANSRSVPPARTAAFTKQLLSVSLHLPAKSAYAVLGLLQSLAKVHGVKLAALWNTDERRGDGVYNALSDEPEASNPFAATAWEGELLKHHFDPKVCESHKMLLKMVKEAGK